MLRYAVGDATAPRGSGAKVIVHVCNDWGAWGRGFVAALSDRWPEPEVAYRAWYRSKKDFELGAVQFVSTDRDLWVANLIGQHGLRSRFHVPVRYEAIRTGLEHVAAFCESHQATVHMPRIGAGLAGGDWNTIVKLIKAALVDQGINVTVYDLPKER